MAVVGAGERHTTSLKTAVSGPTSRAQPLYFYCKGSDSGEIRYLPKCQDTRCCLLVCLTTPSRDCNAAQLQPLDSRRRTAAELTMISSIQTAPRSANSARMLCCTSICLSSSLRAGTYAASFARFWDTRNASWYQKSSGHFPSERGSL